MKLVAHLAAPGKPNFKPDFVDADVWMLPELCHGEIEDLRDGPVLQARAVGGALIHMKRRLAETT